MKPTNILRAPCPACGVVDRVVRASPVGGYRMVRHRRPRHGYEFRASYCAGRALVPVADIIARAQADRALAEAIVNRSAEHREKLRLDYERAVLLSTDQETACRAEVAAYDKAIAKLSRGSR